jgi:5'-phosphate synthase pdxT subunit
LEQSVTTHRVGVLALQGDFREHLAMVERLGAEGVEVRQPGELATVDALIIPGGESTTIGKLAVLYGMIDALRDAAANGMPMYGTWHDLCRSRRYRW